MKKESSIGEFIDEKREYIIKNMYPKDHLKIIFGTIRRLCN